MLVGALALGVILASDVFDSGSSVETLLFGSLLLIGDRELVVAGAASLVAVAATVLLGRRWLAVGFDPSVARSLGVRSSLPDALLLALVAVTVVASLSALGALLVSALLVVPAATTRLWTRTLLSWQLASVALAAVEGVAGLWLSVEANVPPGAAIAVLAGGVFAVAALPRAVPLVAAAALLLAGCGSTGGGNAGVVATTTQIADWARIVGGDAVSVHQILRPNTDPHEYEPRPSDVQAASGAKVVFESGDGLDRWMGKVVSAAGGSPKVVDLGAEVPVKLGERPALVARPAERRGGGRCDQRRALARRARVVRDVPAQRRGLPDTPARARSRASPLASRRSRRASASSSRTTTRSTISRAATGSRSSARSFRRRRPSRSRPPERPRG